MDQHLVATDGKLLHALATLDNDLSGWVHAKGSQDVYDLLGVGSDAVENGR